MKPLLVLAFCCAALCFGLFCYGHIDHEDTCWINDHHWGLRFEKRSYGRYTKFDHENGRKTDLWTFDKRQYCSTWTWNKHDGQVDVPLYEHCSEWIPKGKL